MAGGRGGRNPRTTSGWPAFESELQRAKVRYQAFIYPGVEHGFNNDTTPRYDAAAAKLAAAHDRVFQQTPARLKASARCAAFLSSLGSRLANPSRVPRTRAPLVANALPGSSVTPSASASRVHPWWFIGRAHQLGREHGGLSEKGSSPLRSGGVGGSGHRWKPIFQRLPTAMPYGTRCEIEMCSQRGTRRCLLHIRLAGCQSPYCRENRLCRSHNRPTYLRECRSEAVLD